MRETILGLLMVVLTAAIFWMIGRNRLKCPLCGRVVKWDDVNCPHCGDDMQGRHKVGPAPRRSRIIKTYEMPSRRRRPGG
jgi:predicted amidophosphoribosyltransferase